MSTKLTKCFKKIDTTCFVFPEVETKSPPMSNKSASSITDSTLGVSENNTPKTSSPTNGLSSTEDLVKTKSTIFDQDKEFSMNRDEKAKSEMCPEKLASVESFAQSSNRTPLTNGIDGSKESESPTSPRSKSSGKEKMPIQMSGSQTSLKSKSPEEDKKPIRNSKSPTAPKSSLSEEEKKPLQKSRRSNRIESSQREQHEKDVKRRKRKFYEVLDYETDDSEDQRTKSKKELQLPTQSTQLFADEECEDETQGLSLIEFLLRDKPYKKRSCGRLL